MAGVSLTGLASGLDTDGIISQLMAVEGQGKSRLLVAQRYATGRKTAIEDVGRVLRSLSNAVADLQSAGTWADVQTVASSDAAKFTGRQVGQAPAGSFAVNVLQLARAEQRTFTYAETLDGGGNPQPQELVISDGVTTRTVTVAAGTTPQGVVNAINATSGTPVYAGLVNGKLTLTGKELGRDLTITSSTGSVTEVPGTEVQARLTQYEVNGVRQDDKAGFTVQPGGLPGVELTLKDVGSGTLTIGTPAADAEKVKAKVQAFVDAYNSATDLIRSKLAEKKVANPSTATDFTRGALRGDPTLNATLAKLRQIVGGEQADGTASTIDTFAELGVKIPAVTSSGAPTAEGKAGKVTLDASALLAALAAKPDEVEKAIRDATTGLGTKLTAALDPVVKASGGFLTRSTAAADSEFSRIGTQLTDFDRRLSLKEKRLRAQFTALETALNGSQSQTAWLQGQIAGLPTGSS